MSVDQLRLISAHSEEWNEWVRHTQHDFHHTAAHHRVWQESGYGDAWMAVYGSKNQFVAWPYLQRPINSQVLPGMFDITAVDGYAGPLAAGCASGDAFFAKALDRIFECWRDSKVVSVFTRFHPLLNNQLVFSGAASSNAGGELATCAPFSGLRHEGHTISIDLTLTDREAHAEYRKSHLHQIRRAARSGVTTETLSPEAGLDDFIRLYYKTMSRNGASDHYFFSRNFFERLLDALRPGSAIHVARAGSETIGAVLTTEFGGIVQYLLGGTDDSTGTISPLKVLLEHIRIWARARGNQTLHLGGGRGCQDGDSLFYFKSGFSNRRHCFYTGRWILDPCSYELLVGDRFGAAGRPDGCDFFPAYRAPSLQAERETADCPAA